MSGWNPKANEIFQDALEIAGGAERRAFLDAACTGEAALRQAVDSLLQAHDDAGSLLERPAVVSDFTIDQVGPPIAIRQTERPGSRIGPYKLLEQIGEGGMGVVWMAEQQEPVRRAVALKLIKAGMDSKAVLARFEAERQALALMDHPNIAKVLDAGATPDGTPYFVMELVKGTPEADGRAVLTALPPCLDLNAETRPPGLGGWDLHSCFRETDWPAHQ